MNPFKGYPGFSMPLKALSAPQDGCDIDHTVDYTNRVILIDRGVCSFLEKAEIAAQNGAIGVIIANTLEPENMFVMGGERYFYVVRFS
jgi:hypothetical protein